MFTVRVAVRVRAEGRTAFLAELEDKPREVPEVFPGCRWFGVYVDPEDPFNVLVYEEWANQSAYDDFRESAFVEQVMSVLVPLMDSEPDTCYFQSNPVDPWWQ